MNSPRHGRGFFITGTDTGVGKTTIGEALVRYWRAQGRRVGAYKPVASGGVLNPANEPIWQDVEAYSAALGGQIPRERICPQCFLPPLAPPIAARQAGLKVDEELLVTGYQWCQSAYETTIVEGAGGLLSPISESQSNADLAVKLGLPLLIIARLGLGTINHSLLTIEAAQRRNMTILGVILNASQDTSPDESVVTNPGELTRRCTVPILGVLPYSPDSDLLQSTAFLKITELLGQW